MTKTLLAMLIAGAVGCGSVTPNDGKTGPDGAAGVGGAAGAVVVGAGGAAGAQQKGGESGSGGAAGAVACVPSFAPDAGFAYLAPCDPLIKENSADLASWLSACRADCTLNGKQFVGCVPEARIDAGQVICRSSCSECP